MRPQRSNLKTLAPLAGLALALACGLLLVPALGAADNGAPIATYTAPTVGTYTAPTITADKPGQTPASTGGKSKPAKLSRFFGAWRTFVPGGTYITPGSPGSNTDTLHVSAGAKGVQLVISSNHRWRWHGLTGAWQPTGDAEYPLLLEHALDGHDWKVGIDTHHPARILIWDGYTWYGAKR